MPSKPVFPSLDGWEPTRDTLHWYAQGVGVIPRAHAPSHPKWWHISLKVQPDGLVTDPMSLPDGHTLHLFMNLRNHQVTLSTSRGDRQDFDMAAGLSSTDFADQLITAVAGLDLTGEYARQRFENGELRQYTPEMAERYLTALLNADRVFKQHRNALEGDKGPVQLWPHGFDLAFEWFGTRTVEYEEDGEVAHYPAQLNLGFSPGESSHPEPYFYSNPWPFEADPLLEKSLPAGARWFTDGWQGSILPYNELVDDERAAERLLAYARRVYEASAPTLTA
jgi:hypothetical protein